MKSTLINLIHKFGIKIITLMIATIPVLSFAHNFVPPMGINLNLNGNRILILPSEAKARISSTKYEIDKFSGEEFLQKRAKNSQFNNLVNNITQIGNSFGCAGDIANEFGKTQDGSLQMPLWEGGDKVLILFEDELSEDVFNCIY